MSDWSVGKWAVWSADQKVVLPVAPSAVEMAVLWAEMSDS
jgi:hypothetical protein